jgi:hypothetical protein
MLISTDDFYVLGQGMAMIQTSLNVLNTTIYNELTPKSLLAWQRVRLANAMATTAPEWAAIFAQDNSGTYNNQYIVIDLNKYNQATGTTSEGAKVLLNDTVWLIEQMPGLVAAADQTNLLQTQGYIPSYNLPFYNSIYDKSGYPAHFKENPYSTAPRALIFKAEAPKVTTVGEMEALMRYNDPVNSTTSPASAICMRGDIGTVSVFERNLHSRSAIEFHAFAPLEALAGV